MSTVKRIVCIVVLALLSGVFFVKEERHEAALGIPSPTPSFMPTPTPTMYASPSRAPAINPSAPSPALIQTPPPRPVPAAGNVLLAVSFQSQAPFGQWSQPWQDACEEASLVLANRFARGIGRLTREEMRDEILQLVEYQNDRYGDYKDSDAERTAEIGREVYGIEVDVKEIKEIGEIRDVLKEGKLVVAPMAGRELKNPYFTPPGPLYHMIVIRGFDDTTGEFITNDIGTRRGEGLRYPYERIWDALHDFPGTKEGILEGKKAVIAVRKGI